MMPRILHLSDGAPVRVLEAGDLGAPAALLLHGVGMRAEAWGPQIVALAAHYRVIAADLPGHGGSAALNLSAPDLPDYVAWAARLVQALGLGAVHVVGHSMGALIAMGLAIERPDLVRSAALLNAVHCRTPAARMAVLARADEIAAGGGAIEAPLARWFDAQQSALRGQVAGWLSAVSPQGYAAAYRAFAHGDTVYAARIGEISAPLLVLTGDDDANSTPEMTRDMAALAPQGRAVVIAGHRHMVNLTAPAAVNAALVDWLANCAVPA